MAVTDGFKSHLDNAKDKVTTTEGKEAVTLLQDLVSDTENVQRTVTAVESAEYNKYVDETKKDLQELNDFAKK